MDILHISATILHTITNIFGILTNCVLVFLVMRRTPKRLSTYSVLILNFAVCDLCTCVVTLFVQQRLIPGGLGLFYFSYGPCQYMGAFACYIGYSFMLHCYAHCLWSLLFSFSYRYYIVGHTTPKISTIRIIVLLIYIPSFLQFVTFCFASDNEDAVRRRINEIFNYDMRQECVSGHLNILNWATLFTILHMTVPVTPVYAAILVLRRGIAMKLRQEKAMSVSSRRLHAQLLKAISYQACIPVFFFIAVLTYALGQLGILNHPVLEYSTFIFVGFIPVLSPLTSLHFIRPYRMWVSKNLLRRTGATSVVSQAPEISSLRSRVCSVRTVTSRYKS